MQYIITAFDYKDDKALERRMACREEHMRNIKQMILSGSFLSGGAMLNANGEMMGSSIHVQFDNKKDLEKWLASDVYTTNNVWETVEIQECKLVAVNELLDEK